MYKVINNPEFTQYPPSYMNIDDLSLVFSDGIKWKVISLSDMHQYPVIYDTHQENNIIDDISITFCPFSYSAIIYFEKWVPLKDTYDNNIILQNYKNKNIKIHQLSGKFTKDSELNDFVLRKNEIVIMKVKNVIKNYPDCLYLNNKKIIKSIIPTNYLTNDKINYPLSSKINDTYHPKKLVYGIINSIKNQPSVIVSHKNIYDFDEAGYQDYFEENIKDIKTNGGFIVPSLWFVWMSFYPDSKIIIIQDHSSSKKGN